MIGMSVGKKAGKEKECFDACREYHHKSLDDVEHPVAKAILSYFDRWESEKAVDHPLVVPIRKELKSASFIFQVGLDYAQNVPEIRAVWQREYNAPKGDEPIGRCMLTGERTEIARLHPYIGGVRSTKRGRQDCLFQ